MWPENGFATNIGNFYGDIEEQQLEQAMDSRQNREDALRGGVPPQWEEHIKPFI